MEPPVTYQQLLAEQYQDNATQLLVFQESNYYDDDGEYAVDAYAQNLTLQAEELTNANQYREFAGNRNKEENLIKSDPYDDKSKLSIRYNKDVKTNVFNIDSKFRAYYLSLAIPNYLPFNANASVNDAAKLTSPATANVSHFVVRLSKQVKNAISVKLTSFEMPNKFFNISALRGNNSFVLKIGSTPTTITVSDSYYTVNTICGAINKAIIESGILTGTSRTIVFSYISTTNKITVTITSPTACTYTIDFSNQETDSELYSTLGQMLGFKTYDYSSNGVTKTPIIYNLTCAAPVSPATTSTDIESAEFEPDLNIDTYIYLKINEYSLVIPQTLNDTYYTVFAKIPIVVDKGQIVYDTLNQNTSMKMYHFLQPTNIQQLEIQLLDAFGSKLEFDPNINFSMTLEIEEVLSQSLYEKLREI
jgi:hypothetical protein